jgi:hypothetical protein
MILRGRLAVCLKKSRSILAGWFVVNSGLKRRRARASITRNLENFPLCWVSHSLSINQKSERVSYSKLLLTAPMEQRASGFQRVITGDEPSFVFYYSRDSVWAAPRNELPQRIKRKTDTGKCMVFDPLVGQRNL